MRRALQTRPSRTDLHRDAQVAAIIWARQLPDSFAGRVPCSFDTARGVHISVLNRSLALITSARVQ